MDSNIDNRSKRLNFLLNPFVMTNTTLWKQQSATPWTETYKEFAHVHRKYLSIGQMPFGEHGQTNTIWKVEKMYLYKTIQIIIHIRITKRK